MSRPTNTLFSTRFRYYLNYDTKSGSATVPATSYALGEAKSYSVVIPITRTRDVSNVKFNISTDSSKWYSFPSRDITLDSKFTLTFTGSYSSNNLTITVYVVNQSFGGSVNTAFTLSVQAALFVTPT